MECNCVHCDHTPYWTFRIIIETSKLKMISKAQEFLDVKLKEVRSVKLLLVLC